MESDNIKEELERLQQKCAELKWLHDSSYRMFHLYNQVFGVTYLLTQGTTVVLNVTNIYTGDTKFNVYSLVFLSIAFLLSGIKQFYRFEESSEKHRQSASRFSVLFDNLQHPRNPKGKPETLLSWGFAQYDRILLDSPHISDWIIAYFRKSFKKPVTPETQPVSEQIDSTPLPSSGILMYELQRYMDNDFHLV